VIHIVLVLLSSPFAQMRAMIAGGRDEA
jgi:hypothetical protein